MRTFSVKLLADSKFLRVNAENEREAIKLAKEHFTVDDFVLLAAVEDVTGKEPDPESDRDFEKFNFQEFNFVNVKR